VLQEVFGRFTKGFDNPDLIEAKQLLEKVARIEEQFCTINSANIALRKNKLAGER
jgi:hypothetical protein